MSLLRYDPFAFTFPVVGMRFFDNAAKRVFSEPQTRSWSPTVDILETENELVLKADLPEVPLKDIDLQIEDGTLTIQGSRKFESKQDTHNYHRVERSYGAFRRSFNVPDSVDSENVKAEYKDGVLTVTLPKKEVAKPRTIKVQVAN
jgi:HSP20 family protein